jgi:UTP--glucose-1-phosphate uridylyltransferase
MVNIAIIPIVGSGTRLQPLTYGVPKALLPLGNRTMLQIAIRELHQAGIKDFFVVVDDVNLYKRILSPHPKPNQEIDKAQESAIEEFNALMQHRFHFIQFSDTYPGGLAAPVLECRDYVKNEPFMLILCDDVVFSPINPCSQLIRAFEETGCWSIGLTKISKHEVREFGIVGVKNTIGTRYQIYAAAEKRLLQGVTPEYGMVGRYLFGPGALTIIEDSLEIVRQDPVFTSTGFHITHAIHKKATQGQVVGELLQGKYFHTGTMTGYLSANHYFLTEEDGLQSLLDK